MEIKIQDWNDNDVVNHKTILITGFVSLDGSTYEKYGDILCESGIASKWPVVRGCFKCLAVLRKGPNDIVLKFKETIKNLKVELKTNDTILHVCPVYIICEGHDGRFQAPPGCDNSVESACRRIALGSNLIQTVFGEKLREHGFGRKTFQLETDLSETAPDVRILRSKINVEQAKAYDEQKLWELFGRELMCSEIGNENTKYLAFLSCTYWDGNNVTADPALGGGGLALLGSASLHTWPTEISQIIECFSNQDKIDSDLLDNSCFRGTYGGCYNTSLGAVCHELGHMFNLGHTNTGIMSRGFDHIGRVFTIDSRQKEENVKLVPCLSITVGTGRTSSKPKVGSNILKKYDDMTHLTKSCATILNHHKWFNEMKNVESDMHYDSIRNVLTSENGLKVVQLRASCGAVVKSWELGSKSPHKHLILPRMPSNPKSLVAMDANGNILTIDI